MRSAKPVAFMSAFDTHACASSPLAAGYRRFLILSLVAEVPSNVNGMAVVYNTYVHIASGDARTIFTTVTIGHERGADAAWRHWHTAPSVLQCASDAVFMGHATPRMFGKGPATSALSQGVNVHMCL